MGTVTGRYRVTAPRKPASPRDQGLVEADERLRAAREQIPRAALSCLRGGVNHVAEVRLALDLIDQARSLLRALSEGAAPE